MNILVTGAKGMVGTALVNNLKNIRDGKNKTRPGIHIDEIFEYDLNSTEAELDEYCAKADFVFNLAGVNRPENPEDFMKGNFGFASQGQHWHNSKWEQFIVVQGHGLIQERNINTGETVEFEVSGDKIEAIYMIPGWTHNIINLSETENLVTVMTCNEIFDPKHPDTFFEVV